MEIDCACQGKADSAQMAARQEDARQRRLRNRALSELAPIERGNAQGGLARPVAFARRWRLKKGTYGQIRGAKLRCSRNFTCNKCCRPGERKSIPRSGSARNLIPGTAVGISPKRGTGKRENSSCAQAACPNSADRAVARLARAGGKGNTHVNAHSCKDIVLFSHTDERGKSRADVFRSNNARNFIPGTAVGIFPKRGAGKRENANCAQEAYPNFAGHVAAVSVHRAIKERRIQRFPYPPPAWVTKERRERAWNFAGGAFARPFSRRAGAFPRVCSHNAF